MNYPFSINDLASKCSVSKQSIYNLMKKNQELINNNSIRKQRKIFYNQTVLDFFLAYYDKETTESTIKNRVVEEGQAPEREKSLSESPSVEELPESRIKALESELEAKDAEIKRLNELLAEKEAERKELLNQNGALILTLQQEKQEKVLLLPAPRKPIGEKIKGLFNRKT